LLNARACMEEVNGNQFLRVPCRIPLALPGRRFCPQLSQNPARHSEGYRNKNGIRSFKIAVANSRTPTRSAFHRTHDKALPSSRCASAIKVVRPSQSTAEMQSQFQPAFLRLPAMISQYFTHPLCLGYSKCYQGWLCWRRISSPNHDAQAGWLLYAVDRFSVKRSQS
jgi:hypothetical protein